MIGKCSRKLKEIVSNIKTNEKMKFNASNGLTARPKTGQILVMVGSRDYFDTEIERKLQCSNSKKTAWFCLFKPFVYLIGFNREWPQALSCIWCTYSNLMLHVMALNVPISGDDCYKPTKLIWRVLKVNEYKNSISRINETSLL